MSNNQPPDPSSSGLVSRALDLLGNFFPIFKIIAQNIAGDTRLSVLWGFGLIAPFLFLVAVLIGAIRDVLVLVAMAMVIGYLLMIYLHTMSRHRLSAQEEIKRKI